MERKKRLEFHIDGRYHFLSSDTGMSLDVYRRKRPSFYLALSKQYVHSQNNIDAIYLYTVF